MLDKKGRNIDYLRISLTDRCNLRCVYCMPEKGIEKKCHDEILRFEEIEKIIAACTTLGVKKVRFTGGEPLVLKGIDELIRYTASMPGIEDISLTTNGILLAEMAEDLKKAGLKRVNVSLDTLQPEKYKKITRGGDINKVYKAIEKCISLGMTPVKINAVLMRGMNDDEIGDFLRLTMDSPIQVRFIELMPIGEGIKYFEKCEMKVEEILEMYPELVPVKDDSRVASVYKLPGAAGKVGLISPVSCKFCEECNRIRLTSTGSIKPCLHSAEEVNLRPYINDDQKLLEVIKTAVYNKPAEHHLETEGKSDTKRMMFQIGG
ncbi:MULTISPECIES: GTP 3',8-cyclase MoaA [unclassified Sedimentibacter]|uniref:GTP 3',8-cyclase MoaA n=1 Tax=unclassified Sedimentibacter TaxID=2649220 RepID=UPI0027DF683D|nr:GTP 3',8-cyclase MoaA [Sedimentibacter sp. MB35-C1]WMJ76436.1 GTP 3',8-cyclase MoaA [Sedimentibacter sp. MB35-C1]